MKLKKGDNVLVISGKEKGKKGKIIGVNPREFRLIVEGVHLKKKHRRPTKQGEKGQIVAVQGQVPASNVKFVCPKCSKATRLSYKVDEEKKTRICKQCGAEV